MIKSVERTNQFKRDLKRLLKKNYDLSLLDAAVRAHADRFPR